MAIEGVEEILAGLSIGDRLGSPVERAGAGMKKDEGVKNEESMPVEAVYTGTLTSVGHEDTSGSNTKEGHSKVTQNSPVPASRADAELSVRTQDLDGGQEISRQPQPGDETKPSQPIDIGPAHTASAVPRAMAALVAHRLAQDYPINAQGDRRTRIARFPGRAMDKPAYEQKLQRQYLKLLAATGESANPEAAFFRPLLLACCELQMQADDASIVQYMSIKAFWRSVGHLRFSTMYLCHALPRIGEFNGTEGDLWEFMAEMERAGDFPIRYSRDGRPASATLPLA